jgi:DNA repair exonuclease SbcCD nuclease subunit
MKIAIMSDVHLGIRSNWKRGEDGLSLKTRDNLNRFYWTVGSLDKSTVKLLVIAGDFFDELHVNTTVLINTLKIFEQLEKKGIGVIIIGGNHDSTSNFKKKKSIDVLDTVSNCIVLRSFTTINFASRAVLTYHDEEPSSAIEFNQWWVDNVLPHYSDVGLCLLPFMSMRAIKDIYYKKWTESESDVQAVTRDNLDYFISKIMLQKLMYPNIKECSNKLLFGHYQLANSKLHFGQNETLLPRELIFSKEMIQPDLWNFVGFGHIHYPQSVWGKDSEDRLWKVQHIGATERLNFGEREDRRRYILYDVVKKYGTEVSLDPNVDVNSPQVRPMLQHEVTVPLGTVNPNEYILRSISEKYDEKELGSSICKVIINIHSEDSSRFDRRVLRDMIESMVFYLDHLNVNIVRAQRKEDYVQAENRNLIDLPQVLDMFLKELEVTDKNVSIPDLYDRVSVVSHNILSEAIQKGGDNKDD